MGGSGGFVFTIYFFLASWLRRWRRRPAPAAALPIYQAARAAFPARPPAPPDTGPAGSLEDRLHRENPSLERLYRRIVESCERDGVCTAANKDLGADWYGPGAPLCKRSVQRHLARLVELGAIEILELPRDQIRTGRAIRLPSEVPAQQLQLRLNDARPRRLTPREVELGRADPPPPPPNDRRRSPERPSGGQGGVTSPMSPVTWAPVTGDIPPVTPSHVTRDRPPDLRSRPGGAAAEVRLG